MQVSTELFVSLCVSGWGYGAIDLLYICLDHPINLSFWNVIIFEAWRQDAHWQRSNIEPNDFSEESDRPQFAGRRLCSGRASVWSLSLLSGWIRALIAVASYSYKCMDWGNLFKTSHDCSHTWYEHRMAAQDYLHFSRHWGEGSVRVIIPQHMQRGSFITARILICSLVHFSQHSPPAPHTHTLVMSSRSLRLSAHCLAWDKESTGNDSCEWDSRFQKWFSYQQSKV